MKIGCAIFAVLCVVQLSSAFENAPVFVPESHESLAARPFQKRDCMKDTHEGPWVCMALMWRYKWSEKDQDCVKSVYGGCHGTKNNFHTQEECRKETIPICKSG